MAFRFIAGSDGRKRALLLAKRVAAAHCPVLVMGSTGVGKDVLVEDIHRHSKRSAGPFVAVNCGALSTNLFESELFGHVRGAYTSAVGAKPGLVEIADRGTLFLDEVGELPLDAQVKLLRFLSKGTYFPVGSTTERRADVRIIAATNRDLPSLLDNTFRSDLYFRLSVVSIVVPPLARADVELLARSFLAEICADHDDSLSPSDADRLVMHASRRPFRGGVRELRNVLERFVLLREEGQELDEAWAMCTEIPRLSTIATFDATIDEEAPQYSQVSNPSDLVQRIDDLVFLACAEGTQDVRDLAQRLNRSLPTVYERLKKLGIKPRDLGKTGVLLEAKKKARSELAPHEPWIQGLLKDF